LRMSSAVDGRKSYGVSGSQKHGWLPSSWRSEVGSGISHGVLDLSRYSHSPLLVQDGYSADACRLDLSLPLDLLGCLGWSWSQNYMYILSMFRLVCPHYSALLTRLSLLE
jgi:hypothetical protein